MKHKYCVIRKVPYRILGTKRIVWANVVSEGNGLVLLLVPKTYADGAHSIVMAEENLTDRIFEAVGSTSFEIGSMEVKTIGDTLRILGVKLLNEELMRTLEKEFGDL
jgi:hypothetical protein